ncbi:carbon-nitrogen hydrolase [Penicillium hispanicum]|uniref:carbon-nitrogen hydrolase n=1 Tax=Penicillium hispanicum TaxID=1080232 RepID=UPI00254149F6|nr:carbon-nitrogen hydrolase [Penicillium hispanicum]KAJ5585290.1 carbon-nitrogen hydrolase [Penicillium hispanicum]
MATPTRVAACHVAPIFLSARETTLKAVSLIEQAAQNQAHIVVFPESFIPAFPVWSAVRSPAENHDLFKRMAVESIYADGEEIHAIRAAAKNNGVMVSVGFSEKVRTSCGTLYNSNIIISDQGEIMVHHRKLVPTFFEKLTWAPGDGHGLQVAETSAGKIGNLICGENTNPLARYSLIAQGEQIHISTWPAIWPTRMVASARPDREDEKPTGQAMAGNYDNVVANRTRAAAHCFEAKCFGVLCAAVLGADAIEMVSSGLPHVSQTLRESQRGATMFLDPTGALLEGFTIDEQSRTQEPTQFLQHSEGVLYADLDLDHCFEGKQYHDVVGGYQRLDVFNLEVNRERRLPVRFTEMQGNGGARK